MGIVIIYNCMANVVFNVQQALSLFGAATIGVLIVILLVNYVQKRRESAAESSA